MRKNLFYILWAIGTFLLCAGITLPPYLQYRQRYADAVAEGQVLVSAVYAYKHKTGAWPADLGALAPDFLSTLPEGWQYERREGSLPALMNLAGFHLRLEYYFPPTPHPVFPPGVGAGWVRNDEGNKTYLGNE
jgi:hypothetical protein